MKKLIKRIAVITVAVALVLSLGLIKKGGSDIRPMVDPPFTLVNLK